MNVESKWMYYVFFFIFSVGFSFVINKLFLRAYYNFGNANQYQETDQERWASVPKPLLGGFSFYLLFLFSISTYSILFDNSFLNKEIIGVLLSCSFGFLLGWADDGYGTNPILKFVGQFICANILCGVGLIIPISEVVMVDYMFTVFWVIGMMNSINMLDNMDGITTTTSLIIALVCFFISLDSSGVNVVYASMLIAVAGSLLGFLFFNKSPAKMYMGDTGSMFLGVFLAAASIALLWQERSPEGGIIQVKQFMLPILVFMVPIIDTLTVFVRRIAKKQSPFIGGKDHTTHHLVYFGYTDRQVMYWFMGANLFFGGLAFMAYMYRSDLYWIWSVGTFLLFGLVYAGTQWYYNIGKRRNTLKEKRKVIQINAVQYKKKKA